MFVVELRKGVYLKPFLINEPAESKSLYKAEFFGSRKQAQVGIDCYLIGRSPRAKPKIIEIEIQIKAEKGDACEFLKNNGFPTDNGTDNPKTDEGLKGIKDAKEEAQKYQIAVNALKKIAMPEVFTQIAKDMKGLAIETLKEISEL